MELKSFVKHYENVLSPQTCERIIQEFENNRSHITQYDNEHYKFDQLDLNTSGNQLLAKAFIQQVVPYLKNYISLLSVEPYVKIRGFENVRIKKYLKGSDYKFKTHVDVDDKDSAVRYLIFILYLNDNNGCTTFPNLGLSFKPKQGSMIMFPPFWMFPHSGETPTDNDKYIMMSCLHYS